MDVMTEDWPMVRFGEDGRQAPFTESEVDRLVPLITQHHAPRRFALCEVLRDKEGQPYDVSVIAWGVQVGLSDDSVAVIGYPDGSGQAMHGSFRSAETARRVLAVRGDVRLAWVDADPDQQAD